MTQIFENNFPNHRREAYAKQQSTNTHKRDDEAQSPHPIRAGI
jgi:hypothetical protein